jgi:DNA-binding response OmpR family regulator
MHGGEMTVASDYGQGSTFTFTLPLRAEDVGPRLTPSSGTSAAVQTPVAAPTAPATPVRHSEEDLTDELDLDLIMSRPEADADAAQAVESAAPPAAPSPLHVLVVDDDPDIRRLLALQLESKGFEVTQVSSGREALALVKERRPDLITLDVMMPGLDGFETLAALKAEAESADIPVVMLSVLPEEERGFALGAADYLPKPPDPDQLVLSIREVLAQPNAAPSDATRALRVLVVDDEPDLVGWLQTALQTHGITVIAAHGGREGLAKAVSERPDAIVMDVRMPDMSGLDVIRALKDDPVTAGIPVIFMTASDINKSTARARMIGLGAAELIGKPFSADTLVTEILRQTQLLQELQPAGAASTAGAQNGHRPL